MSRSKQLDELRPLGPRADEAHLAPEHVEELRQLVERDAAQEAADAACAGRRPRRRRAPSPATGAKPASRRRAARIERNLRRSNGWPSRPDAPLAEEHRARRAEPDRRARPQHQRRAATSSISAASGAVERVLDVELPALRVDRAQAEQRHAAEALERDAVVDRLEQARHERDLEAELLAVADERDEARGRARARRRGSRARRRSAAAIRARSSGEPSTGSCGEPASIGASGSASRKPTGRRPYSGLLLEPPRDLRCRPCRRRRSASASPTSCAARARRCSRASIRRGAAEQQDGQRPGRGPSSVPSRGVAAGRGPPRSGRSSRRPRPRRPPARRRRGSRRASRRRYIPRSRSMPRPRSGKASRAGWSTPMLATGLSVTAVATITAVSAMRRSENTCSVVQPGPWSRARSRRARRVRRAERAGRSRRAVAPPEPPGHSGPLFR